MMFYPIDLLCVQPAACQFVFEIVFHIVDFKICRLESKGSHAETVTEARGDAPSNGGPIPVVGYKKL
jgi:hypothetical protein